MSKDHIAVVFYNGIGNFIFFSSALKVLKNWGYDKIDLITHEKFLNNPGLMEISENIFENITTEFKPENYDRVYIAGWSVPKNIHDRISEVNPKHRFITWGAEGIHEVQEYLQMIGASWQDFDGYILEPVDNPILDLPHPRIALANCAPNNVAKQKGWKYFPELSELLEDLGYSVILLGLPGELDDCVGTNFVGQLDLKQSAKVLQQCDVLISVSTGLSIVADVVKTPVVLIEGPMLTSRAHPLQSKYTVVRRFISCAPCFQKLLWKICDNPICMDEIKPDEVIQELIRFLPHVARPSYFWDITNPEKFDGMEYINDKTVSYLIPCFDRYHVLKQFLEAFEKSHPMKGDVFFLNDASSDPRITDLLQSFTLTSDYVIHYLESEYDKKLDLLKKYRVNPSVHAYNILIKAFWESECNSDYVMICDPDIIMSPYWTQKMVNTYEEAKESNPDICTFSGFHANHPIYDNDETFEIHETSSGRYRIRNGSNIPYMLEASQLKEIHGLFEVETSITSSDIKKNAELTEKGKVSLVLIPSVVEHVGAFDTSLRRSKSSIVAEYYDEQVMSDL